MNMKKVLPIIIVLAIASPLAYCGIFTHEYSGPEIRGTVTDAETGKPISGAVVTWNWEGQIGYIAETRTRCYRVDFATTDANGIFTFPAWTIKNSELPYFFQRVDYPISIFEPGYEWFNGPLKSKTELQVKSTVALSDAEKINNLVKTYSSTICAYASITMTDVTKHQYVQLIKNLRNEAQKLQDSDLKDRLLKNSAKKLKELDGSIK